jgi:viroplasmin and RNaseH domain-containing protein
MVRTCLGMLSSVDCGREPGVYPQWAQCHAQVSGFSNGWYKRNETKDEAFTTFGAYMEGGTYEQNLNA